MSRASLLTVTSRSVALNAGLAWRTPDEANRRDIDALDAQSEDLLQFYNNINARNLSTYQVLQMNFQ